MNLKVNTLPALNTSFKPLMILNVWADGAVSGAVMRSSTNMDLTGLIATTYSRPHEVIGFISEIAVMEPGDITHGLQRKNSRIQIHSLSAAVGQEYEKTLCVFDVMIYYKGQWHLGHPSLAELRAKKYIPSFKRIDNPYQLATDNSSAQPLDTEFTALAGQTTSGCLKVLNQSLGFAMGLDNEDALYIRDPQYTAAVKQLCNWWNCKAPEEYRNAGAFYVYQWSRHERKFMSCVKGIDDLTTEQLIEKGSYALFQLNAGVSVAVVFLCVKEAMIEMNGRVHVLLANGDPGYTYEAVANQGTAAKANEARKSIAGLVNFLTFGDDEIRKFG